MESKKYTPCGGCGATEPDQRCIGCMHPFTEIKPDELPVTPEWELINRIVSQWGNAVEMPNMEQWLKDYAASKRGAGWVKAIERLPEHQKNVIVRGYLNEQGYSDYPFVAYGHKAGSLDKPQMYFEYGTRSFLTNDVEWLDESPATFNPELFQVISDAEQSKEDDLKAVKEAIGGAEAGREDWISVDERLPYRDGDSSVYCLVNDTYNGIVVRPFNEAHQCWDGEDGDDYYTDAKGGKITHWKPLPDSPFKQQKEK